MSIPNLVFCDLNGLLLHKTYRASDRANGWQCGNFLIVFRPGVEEFLRWLKTKFHLVIWCSARKRKF